MPERLLREPWRLALFFVAVFGLMIVCTGALVWQQTAGNISAAKAIAGIRDLQERSDRNNQTGWKTFDQARLSYEAGSKARAQLVAMVTEEKRMNKQLLAMNRQEIAYQRALVKILRRLEKRRR